MKKFQTSITFILIISFISLLNAQNVFAAGLPDLYAVDTAVVAAVDTAVDAAVDAGATDSNAAVDATADVDTDDAADVAADVDTDAAAAAAAEPTLGHAARSVRNTAAPAAAVTAPAVAGFTDVHDSDWFFPYIDELAQRGLTRGNPDGTYAPDAPLLIDEFLAFTLRTLGEDLPNGNEYWAENYIIKAIQEGIIDTAYYNKFDLPITREQMADIIVNTAKGTEFENYKDYDNAFSDIRKSKFRYSIQKAVELGVLAGYIDGTFRPENTATRAEAAAIVLRMIDDNYKVERYGNVVFTRAIDMREDGMLKKEKSKDFIMELVVDNLHIGISEDNKAVFSGNIPEVPDGQRFYCEISAFDKNGKYLAFASTLSRFPEETIPAAGGFIIETNADIGVIGSIMIRMGTYTGDLWGYDYRDPATKFTIYKCYYESNHISQFFSIQSDEESEMHDFDFNLTRGIWGW